MQEDIIFRMTSEVSSLGATTSTGLTLVLGADAVGKSTFLSNLDAQLGYETFEPTSSDEIRAFKKANLDTVIDANYINERRNLFLGLSLDSDVDIQNKGNEKSATTSSTLITVASHDLMEVIIGARPKIDRPSIIDRWKLMSLFIPENIVFIHADENEIRSRIENRQKAGHVAERFWGFNSPFYLSQYQKLLRRIFEDIQNEGEVNCISLNSSNLDPNEMIELYETKK